MNILQESLLRRDTYRMQIVSNIAAYTLAAEGRLDLDNPNHPVPEFQSLRALAPPEVAEAFKFFAGEMVNYFSRP